MSPEDEAEVVETINMLMTNIPKRQGQTVPNPISGNPVMINPQAQQSLTENNNRVQSGRNLSGLRVGPIIPTAPLTEEELERARRVTGLRS